MDEDGRREGCRHSGEDRKHAPTVQVTIDGKPKPLGALQKGMRARATPVRIEALDKNKDFAK